MNINALTPNNVCKQPQPTTKIEY